VAALFLLTVDNKVILEVVIVFLGAGVRVLLGAVSRGRERRSDTGDGAGQATRSRPE
jgi:hypothetical protein